MIKFQIIEILHPRKKSLYFTYFKSQCNGCIHWLTVPNSYGLMIKGTKAGKPAFTSALKGICMIDPS